MKRLATLVLVAGLLAGCNVPLLTSNGGKPVLPGTNQPVEPLGGVTFKPITAANARLIGSSGGNVISAGGGNLVAEGARAAAPAAAPAPTMAGSTGGAVASDAMISKGAPSTGTASAGGAYSGNVWSSYGYGGYFGPYGGGYGGTDPMALVSVTEAETSGGKGSFQDVVKGVAAPVIKAWAPDARLISSNATLGSDGQVFVDPNQPQANVKAGFNPYGGGYYGDTPGWRFTYLSTTRNEVLNFYVTPQKSLIIRMRWAPLTLAPELVTVDSASAIKKLIAAIEDKGYKGEEEKTGLDYFLGTPFDQPKTPETNEYNKTEVVYDVPDKARWNVSLQSVMGRLVWELNYYAYNEAVAYPAVGGVVSAGTAVAVDAPMAKVAAFGVQQVTAARPAIAPAPMPMPYYSAPPTPNGEWRESYFNNSANGMVDAVTGAVIRFTRPTRNFYRDYSYQKPPIEPYPVPTVGASATPTPTPSTKPEPEPDVDPNGENEGDTGSDTGDTTSASNGQ